MAQGRRSTIHTTTGSRTSSSSTLSRCDAARCVAPLSQHAHSKARSRLFAQYYYDPNGTAAQYAWLEADLAAVDRSRTPWLIVLGHKVGMPQSAVWLLWFASRDPARCVLPHRGSG